MTTWHATDNRVQAACILSVVSRLLPIVQVVIGCFKSLAHPIAVRKMQARTAALAYRPSVRRVAPGLYTQLSPVWADDKRVRPSSVGARGSVVAARACAVTGVALRFEIWRTGRLVHSLVAHAGGVQQASDNALVAHLQCPRNAAAHRDRWAAALAHFGPRRAARHACRSPEPRTLWHVP